ncbi:MAG: FtsK/SpoIIIE domain-containing protein, partial [Coriobacteriia bacterium]|nr:FtsK/SpoIIIE domain-containing protein [Coriobacteriia bacterium]
DQEPAATGAGQAKVASKSAKGRSGQSGGPEAAGAGASGAHGAPASGTSDAAAKQQFKLPSMSLLKVSRNRGASRAQEAELRAVAAELQDTLREFQVDAQVVGWTAGPTVTLYKLSLGEGVRVARITSLADDIALALAASSVRIFSPIPGTSLVGVEVPNAERSLVLLGDVLPNAPSGSLQVAIGKDVEGSSIVANLTGMPHLLIGGTTGSGKSVAINSMIMSMLMRATPQEVRMILIDPKMVELTRYNDIPHLYVPVVTDATKAAAALAWSVLEMERRLRLFMDAGVKNIASYNEQVREEREKAQAAFAKKAEAAAAKQAAAEAAAQAEIAKVAAEKVAAAVPVPSYAGNGPIDLADYDIDELLDVDENGPIELDEPMENGPIEPHGPMEVAEPGFIPIISEPEEDPLADLPEELPLIAIVIDELADLMIVAGKDVESSVTRLSQLARAAGLHLVIATQRPSTNVITGVIKANIVNRIAFNVGSGIDSRVILDSTGAEALLGNGDLLFSKPEYGKPVRIQGCFVSEAEINDVANFWRGQGQPDYHEEILATAVGGMSTYQTSLFDSAASDDPLVWEAADIVVTTQMGSTSTLQRRLKVGYARAGRIMDNLEQKGIVGPANGSKPREVIVSDVLELESIKALEYADY